MEVPAQAGFQIGVTLYNLRIVRAPAAGEQATPSTPPSFVNYCLLLFSAIADFSRDLVAEQVYPAPPN